jgi:hypothetical protein
LGISVTQAPVVHLLASGWQVDDGWIERALAHFDNPRVAAVTPAIYDSVDRNRLLAFGAGYRRGGRKTISRELPEAANQSALRSTGPLLQGAFYRKQLLEAMHGLPRGIGEYLVDVDLALSLRHAGWEIALDPKCRLFAPAIDESNVNDFVTSLWSERLFWRHASQLGSIGSLLAHPGTVLGDLATSPSKWKIPLQILGRLVALFQGSHYRQYRQAVAELKSVAIAEELTGNGRQDPAIVTKTAVPNDRQLRVDNSHKAAGPTENRQSAPSRRQKSRR